MRRLLVRALKRKEEDGFALIDAIVAIVVFSVGLLGAVKFINAMQDQIILQRMQLIAHILAQNKLEQIDSKTTYTTGTGTYTAVGTDGVYKSTQGNYKSFKIKVNGTDLAPIKAARFDVYVQYGYKGHTATVKMSSIIMTKS